MKEQAVWKKVKKFAVILREGEKLRCFENLQR
jgi:hypothetical protein